MNLSNLDHPLSSRIELEGHWVSIDGADFRIMPLNGRNRRFRVFGAKYGAINDENLPILAAEAVVLDWAGLVAEGEEIPYSASTAKELFALHPALCDAVIEQASMVVKADEDTFAAEVGQLKKPPAGKRNGQERKGI